MLLNCQPLEVTDTDAAVVGGNQLVGAVEHGVEVVSYDIGVASA